MEAENLIFLASEGMYVQYIAQSSAKSCSVVCKIKSMSLSWLSHYTVLAKSFHIYVNIPIFTWGHQGSTQRRCCADVSSPSDPWAVFSSWSRWTAHGKSCNVCLAWTRCAPWFHLVHHPDFAPLRPSSHCCVPAPYVISIHFRHPSYRPRYNIRQSGIQSCRVTRSAHTRRRRSFCGQ